MCVFVHISYLFISIKYSIYIYIYIIQRNLLISNDLEIRRQCVHLETVPCHYFEVLLLGLNCPSWCSLKSRNMHHFQLTLGYNNQTWQSRIAHLPKMFRNCPIKLNLLHSIISVYILWCLWDLLLEAQGPNDRKAYDGSQGSMQPKSAAPSRYLLQPRAVFYRDAFVQPKTGLCII